MVYRQAPVFYFALAYDHLVDGEGSKARCDALAEKALEMSPLLRHIVLTGGRDANRTELPSLAAQMAAYILDLHPFDVSIAPSAGWGTLPEIDAFFQVARRVCPEGPATVYVSTNPGHMLRALIYMNAMKPKGWRIRPVFAKHRFCWKDRLVMEPLKVARSVMMYPGLRRRRR